MKAMGKSRLEAFSDGVLAIVLTIMVLELKVPHGDSWEVLEKLLPTLASYVLSFVYVAIYWNNHHHMMHTVTRVNGSILWANMALLFWLSLVPFVTGWMGENHFATRPVAAYGLVLLMAALSYYVLSRTIIRAHAEDSVLASAVGKDLKGKLSLVLYASAIVLSFVSRWAGLAIYWCVAIMWLLPDRRIEKKVAAE
ncbi:MAG TPA: TMEM175 family protein [Labilithrix sp.]|nr:TMEM175 family protein [Labilithrix sp.]